jgi:hypothetical protein
MRRSRLPLAVLVSVLLHGALGLWWGSRPARTQAVVPARREPLTVEVVERAPARAPPVPPPPVAPPVVPPHRAPRPPAVRAAPPAVVARPPAAPPPPAAAPQEARDVPRAVRLFPGAAGLAVVPAPPSDPPSSGHTMRAGEEPSAEQLRAEERQRVHDRVQEAVEDELAMGRVENGLVDSYFGEMNRALERGLTGSALFGYQGVLDHFFRAGPERTRGLTEMAKRYQAYGVTGNPDGRSGASGRSLEDVARGGAWRSEGPNALEQLGDYTKGSSALSLQLRLEQSPTGALLDVKVLEGSGNPLFDAYVLERVPVALAGLGTASEHFARRTRAPTVRSVWRVDGWVSFTRTIKLAELSTLDASDAAYLSALLATSLLKGGFDEVRGEVSVPDVRRPHFDIHTRLERVY